MPKINSKLTGTAGEHYVAYKLSSMGLVAAIPREGAPTVDILVFDDRTSKTASIQVKSTEWATRERGRGENRKPNHLEFPLGYKATNYNSENLFFAFVDLNGLNWDEKAPDIYIIPSEFIYNYCLPWKDKVKMWRFHIDIPKIQEFKNNWSPLLQFLGHDATNPA